MAVTTYTTSEIDARLYDARIELRYADSTLDIEDLANALASVLELMQMLNHKQEGE
jgi:hypothetical protein